MNPEPTPVKNPLVGRWFHSFDGDTVKCQGQILAMVSPDLFLVQFYEWFYGETSTQELIPLEQMKDWKFYDTDKDMKYTYEHVYLPQIERQERVEDAERVAKWEAEWEREEQEFREREP